MVADEAWDIGMSRADGMEIARRLSTGGVVDFLNIIRGHIDSDNALTGRDPHPGHARRPTSGFRRRGPRRAPPNSPVFHAARINDVATARHAIAEGKLDMVGMTPRPYRRAPISA